MGRKTDKIKNDCPLSATEWVNYFQNWKSQIITIALSQILVLITAFAFFGSLIYFAKIRENIVDNLILGRLDVANSYVTILAVILLILFFIGLGILFIVIGLNIDMKKAACMIEKIIEGENNSNKIRKLWLEKIKREGRMKKIKDFLKRLEQEKEIEQEFEPRMFAFLKQISSKELPNADKIKLLDKIDVNPYEWYIAFINKKLSKRVLTLTYVLLVLTFILTILTFYMMFNPV